MESSFEELSNNTAGRLRLVLSIWCWVSQPSWCLCNRKVADHGEEYNTITITWFSRLNFLWCSSREKQVDSRMVGEVSRNYIADNRLLQDSIPSKIGMVEGTWGERWRYSLTGKFNSPSLPPWICVGIETSWIRPAFSRASLSWFFSVAQKLKSPTKIVSFPGSISGSRTSFTLERGSSWER